MNGSRAVDHARRRERLILQAAAQRDRLAAFGGELATPFRGLDRALEALRWVRMHPGLLLGGVAAFGVARPRGVLRALVWAARAWAVARALRTTEPRLGWMLVPRLVDLLRGWRRRR